MAYQIHYEERPTYLYVRVDGENSRDAVATYMQEIQSTCEQQGITRVLIHECLTGPRLQAMDVFSIASEGSLQALGVFEAVAYVDEAMGDTMEFAETVAVNRGMPVSMFKSLSDAERWIASQSEAPFNFGGEKGEVKTVGAALGPRTNLARVFRGPRAAPTTDRGSA